MNVTDNIMTHISQTTTATFTGRVSMMLRFHCDLVRFSMKIFSDPAATTTRAEPLNGSSCLSADTERALQVMEACQAGAAEGAKGHAEKLLNIFQSDLFQALLGNVFLHSTNVLPQCGCSVHGAIFTLRSERVWSWTGAGPELNQGLVSLSVLRFDQTNRDLLNWTVLTMATKAQTKTCH